MEIIPDRSKSLEELEGNNWGEPSYDSHLVTTCHRLRRKPLVEFTVEDLRIMIGQNISLPYLIPLAIERLVENPLVSGDFYPGDLLKNVLSIESSFWQDYPDLWWEVEDIVRSVEMIQETIGKQIVPATERFRQALNSVTEKFKD